MGLTEEGADMGNRGFAYSNPKMEYVEFGKTGRKVSRLGFGGAPSGLKNYLGRFDPGSAQAFNEVVDAIHAALELGVTYFDTAAAYGDHQSERMFGEGLQGADPQRVFLATKFSPRTADDMRRSLEESLTCLKRESVDLLQIHGSSYKPADVDAILADGGILEAMEEAKRQGLTRFIGFTTEDNNDGVYRLIGTGRFDAVQMCYNLFFQHPYEASRPFGSLLESKNAGLGTVTMRTTTSGTLQRWLAMVRPGDTFDYMPALIQFVLSNPYVDVALVGMRTRAEVEKNVATASDLSARIDFDQLFQRYV